MPPPPRRPLLFRDRGGSLSGDFDVLPEAEAFSHPLHRRSRCLVAPGGAVVARAVDHHVVELDAVRAGAIRLRLRRLLEPLQAHRGAREIVVAVALDDVVAIGDHAVVERCLHVRVLRRGAPKRGEYTGHYPCSEAADGMILDRKLQTYERTSPCNDGRLSALGARPIQIRARSPETQLAAAAALARENRSSPRAAREQKFSRIVRARRRLHEHTGAPI